MRMASIRARRLMNLPHDVQQRCLFYGSGDEDIQYYMRRRLITKPFEGVFTMLMERVEEQ